MVKNHTTNEGKFGEEGSNMNLFTEDEVVYRGTHFSFLQFIRMDEICEVCYLTLKNILTGEMFTFEQAGIVGIREISGTVRASAKENTVA